MTTIPSNCVILKPGKEKAIRQRHHWIFSGAVQTLPSFENGDILPIHAADGALLGSGYFNRKSGIIGRLLAFDATPPIQALLERLDAALAWRIRWFEQEQTTAYRLVNGEGDGIPGLVIDRYENTLVLQSGALGIDRLKPVIVDHLIKRLQLQTIYEKSLLPSRKEEGLAFAQGYLAGEENPDVLFKENGLQFTASLPQSQKTGFFLDHREMRQWVRSLTAGKRVLNAFSYTGGFTVYALAGGAKKADSLDISQEAIQAAQQHVALNGFNAAEQQFICEDVFSFLREQEKLPYDLVILDPPAFAKRQKDIIAACRGYKDINRLALQKMPSQSLLLTCSCSHHVDAELFQKVVFQATLEAKRQVRIIGQHRLAPDHPINIFHPESNYLKSLLLLVE
jgi:23S rRNA (cytosine1962-C5)-methyltransferase